MTGVDRTSSDKIDPALSERYRQIAGESVSDELDRVIMHAAREAVLTGRGRTWGATWFRSIAVVAMAGLSFALLLKMSDGNLAGPQQDVIKPTSPVAESHNSFEAAADVTAARIREAEAAARTLQSLPVPTADMTANFSSNLADTLLPAKEYCDETERASTGTWWSCIRVLESRGASVAAERELTALLESFPGFDAPD